MFERFTQAFGADTVGRHQSGAGVRTPMDRRRFLRVAGATGIGVAAVGGLGIGAGTAFAGAGPAAAGGAAEQPPADGEGSMVAYVHNARTGEVAMMMEGREVIVTDPGLVAALRRAMDTASRG